MKKTALIFFALILAICSCSNQDKTGNNLPAGVPTNPVTDPDQFIGKHKAKAMVLGVFHFSNPGLDVYKPKFPFNILEPGRQRELDELLKKLAEYKPTKILVEWKRIERDSSTNALYQKYLDGKYSIDDQTNEVYQVGFKLAKALGHNRIYCSDADANWCGVEMDFDKFDDDAYLKSHGQYEKAKRYKYTPLYEFLDSLKTVQTLTENLRTVNDPKIRLKDHQAYLTDIMGGAGDNYLWADMVANWYRRNLRIFANAYDFTDFNQEERLLLIYGSGHVWQLRQLFTDSPDFDYVEVNDYLSR